jgi:DNA-directed RNA polymerase specialized sigma24 family protein
MTVRRSSIDRPQTDYQVFRRAVVLRDQKAWHEIHTHYTPWLHAIIRARRINEINRDAQVVEELAHETLRKFWQSFTPDKFMRSQGLGQILSYLESCAISAINTWFRRPEKRWDPLTGESNDSGEEKPELSLPDLGTPDPLDAVLVKEQEDERRLVWKCLIDHCANELERLVIRRWAVEGKSFKDIFEEDVSRWGNKIGRVYQCWRNYCERKFTPECLSLLDAWLA